MRMKYTFPDVEDQDGLVSAEKVEEVQAALRTCRNARTHQWPSRLSGGAFLAAHMPEEACTVCGTRRSAS